MLHNLRLCGLVVRVPGYGSRGPVFRFLSLPDFLRSGSGTGSTIEEPPGRNSSDSGLESREYGRGDPLRWPRDTLYLLRFAITSPTSGVYSVGIVRSQTKAMEFLRLCVSSCF
jgi:hypothetical protein